MAKDVKDQKKPPANGLKRLEERLTKVARHSGFPAYVRANFATFSRVVESVGRNAAKWDEIAEWANEEGLSGDRKVTAIAAKRAYEREKKRREQSPKPTKSEPKSSSVTGRPPVRVHAEPAPKPSGVPPGISDVRERMKRAGQFKKPKESE